MSSRWKRLRWAGALAAVALWAGCPGPVGPPDGGNGGGDDGGSDAGLDPGLDAGDDAGLDAGEPDAGPSLRCLPRDGGVPDGGLLRVVAANLSSGNLQSWTPGEGVRILQGLKPDVALMQEWNLSTGTEEERRAFVDATFGPEFCFHLQAGGSIPNGVVSRWPILEAGEWEDSQVGNRAFAWARIDVPGPRDLWAVSVHLLTSNATQRTLEAQDLVAYINAFVPAGDLLVLGGDFNTNSRTESTMATFAAVVRTGAPFPVDASGNGNTNASRAQPYDWVLADPDLAARQVRVVVGDAGFDAGLVFDSRVYNPLSDVAPVLATDSAAVNMQHMAVVKDFLLP